MKMNEDLRHTDRCFDIDEPTSDTLNSTQQGPLEYGKRVDAHRLAAVSAWRRLVESHYAGADPDPA